MKLTFPPPVLTGSGSTGSRKRISAKLAPRGKDVSNQVLKNNQGWVFFYTLPRLMVKKALEYDTWLRIHLDGCLR